MSRASADHVAAWTTGIGVGLVAFMLTWLIGQRITELVWDQPTGPIVALGAATVIGAFTAVVAGRRLSRGVAPEEHRGRPVEPREVRDVR